MTVKATLNHRQELFAQALAIGKSEIAAHAEAGYATNAPAACRLASLSKIRARVAEIRAKSAERFEITRESLAAMYLQDRTDARDKGQYRAAISAVSGIAKLFGFVVEKHEVGKPGDFDRMTDAELRDFIASESAALGIGREGGIPARGSSQLN